MPVQRQHQQHYTCTTAATTRWSPVSENNNIFIIWTDEKFIPMLRFQFQRTPSTTTCGCITKASEEAHDFCAILEAAVYLRFLLDPMHRSILRMTCGSTKPPQVTVATNNIAVDLLIWASSLLRRSNCGWGSSRSSKSSLASNTRNNDNSADFPQQFSSTKWRHHNMHMKTANKLFSFQQYVV